jgi:hypothetical protein
MKRKWIKKLKDIRSVSATPVKIFPNGLSNHLILLAPLSINKIIRKGIGVRTKKKIRDKQQDQAKQEWPLILL